MFKKIFNYFSSPKKLAITNAVLLAAIIICNIFFQVFCVPTLWAASVLIICFTSAIVYPFLKDSKFKYLTGFINGFSIGVFTYCIIFLNEFNYFGFTMILLFGLGIVVYIPHFFILQLLIKDLVLQKDNLARLLFVLGMGSFLTLVLSFNLQYKKAMVDIAAFKKSGFTKLEQSFMTEKIVGMYFKYHTEICIYDGWRPPLHDPALIIGQWFNGKQDPLTDSMPERYNLSRRIELYQKFFPDESVKVSCSCALQYSGDYHSDALFRNLK